MKITIISSFETDYQPTVTLRSDKEDVFTGVQVTLTCTVESSGWMFYYYRQTKDSTPMTMQGELNYIFRPTSVSEGGEYWCRAGRGEPVYYTQYSNPVHINVTGEFKGL